MRRGLVVFAMVFFLAGAELFTATAVPRLMLDTPDLHDLTLQRFRRADDPFFNPPYAAPSRKGLAEMAFSGSAQFSREGWQRLREKLEGRDIVVVDLRQESHGFVNGEIPVSWRGEHNTANMGLTPEEIEEDEQGRLQAITRGGITAISFDDPSRPSTVIEVTSAWAERGMVEADGQRYVRVPVTDHRRPESEEVERFLTLVRELPEGAWVHFHCQAGLGRTTLFMAMLDMLMNANEVSFDDILTRQQSLGGIDLRDVGSPRSWQHKYYSCRLDFLRLFYEYAQKTGGDDSPTWAEWMAHKSSRYRR